MLIFISGGCKNGKSTFAQRLAQKLARGGPLYYIATMVPHDEEDHARIRRHIAERDGWGFQTLECPRDIASCLTLTGGRGAYLLDSVTALLSNEMFTEDGQLDPDAAARTAEGLRRFADGVEHAVFVSDYIYSDAALYDDWTERYRRGLAALDRLLAQRCDAVVEVCAGQTMLHKGALPQ